MYLFLSIYQAQADKHTYKKVPFSKYQRLHYPPLALSSSRLAHAFPLDGPATNVASNNLGFSIQRNPSPPDQLQPSNGRRRELLWLLCTSAESFGEN